jgi:hypothetical protein
MDNFRRRPPMEGFSRPGSLGGEAYDDDSVEGHIMDDERQQQEDTEGHGWRRATEEDDTEGHGGKLRGIAPRADEEDTEGHAMGLKRSAAEDDDTEGHDGSLRAAPRADGDDDDTEGHASQIR